MSLRWFLNLKLVDIEKLAARIGMLTWLVIMTYAALIMIGAPVEKPAWASDIQQINIEINNLEQVILTGQSQDDLKEISGDIKAHRLDLKATDREIRSYEREGISVPDFLIEDKQEIEDSISDALRDYEIKLQLHEIKYGGGG